MGGWGRGQEGQASRPTTNTAATPARARSGLVGRAPVEVITASSHADSGAIAGRRTRPAPRAPSSRSQRQRSARAARSSRGSRRCACASCDPQSAFRVNVRRRQARNRRNVPLQLRVLLFEPVQSSSIGHPSPLSSFPSPAVVTPHAQRARRTPPSPFQAPLRGPGPQVPRACRYMSHTPSSVRPRSRSHCQRAPRTCEPSPRAGRAGSQHRTIVAHGLAQRRRFRFKTAQPLDTQPVALAHLRQPPQLIPQRELGLREIPRRIGENRKRHRRARTIRASHALPPPGLRVSARREM